MHSHWGAVISYLVASFPILPRKAFLCKRTFRGIYSHAIRHVVRVERSLGAFRQREDGEGKQKSGRH